METALLWLAVVFQGLDAGVTCHTLRQGGKELNPLLPQSCAGIVAMKAAFTAPVFVLKGKHRMIWSVAMIGSGGVGLTVTLVRK